MASSNIHHKSGPSMQVPASSLMRLRQPACLDKLWLDLSKGLENIYKSDTNASPAPSEHLYRLLYQYCTSGSEEPRRLAGTSLSTGHKLHNLLREFLRNYLTTRFRDGTELKSGDLLRSYIQEWEEYKRSSGVLNKVFLYFNQCWVQKERREGRTNTYDAYQLAVVCWRDRVFKALWADLTDVLLNLIEEERNGESIDSDLVRRGVFSYVEVGVNADASSNLDNLTEYRAAFESSFLLETYSFYKNKSADFLRHNSVTDYMKEVEQRLGEEKQRVDQYLHVTTSKPLAHYCNRALISDHHEIFRTEFKKMLHEDKSEDLKCMFRLFSRTEGGLRDLMTIFEEHVQTNGLSAVEKVGKRGAMDPELYFSVMLQVHSKCKKHVIEAFNKNSGFVDALDKACVSFVNTNAVTYLTNSPTKSPELLARYCDTLLIESAAIPEESGLEHLLDQVMVLFKYIKEKDVFKRFYAQLLAKRLVDRTSASDDAEDSMIRRLNVACGPDYVRTLRRMLQDIEDSEWLNEEFKERALNAKEVFGFDFNVRVMTSGSWPFNELISFQLPEELKQVVQNFTAFYYRKTDRKLQWLHNRSYGVVDMNCFQQPYTLEVSTYQMAVLLMYNFVDSFTVQQLKEETGIPMDTLRDVLESLLQSKILESERWSSKETEELKPNTVVALSREYSNRTARVNIKNLLKNEVRDEQVSDQKQIDNERKFSIQTAIVRIMKAEVMLKHKELLAEVTTRFSSMFPLTKRAVKNCIDSLIEKNYLERDEEQLDTYIYIG